MPNKTIYVSEKDESVFEQAQNLAGEALSAVIARALREFVTRHQSKENGMKDIKIKVGTHKLEREQRFVGRQVGKWDGLSDDKEYWFGATVYRTQKGNWAIHLMNAGKASLLVHGAKDWTEWADSGRGSELMVGATLAELSGKIPAALLHYIEDVAAKEEQPVEYLDI